MAATHPHPTRPTHDELGALGTAVDRLAGLGTALLADAGLPGRELTDVQLAVYPWDDDETECTLAVTLTAGPVHLELQARHVHGTWQDEFRVGRSRWRSLPAGRTQLAAALAEAETGPARRLGRARRARTVSRVT